MDMSCSDDCFCAGAAQAASTEADFKAALAAADAAEQDAGALKNQWIPTEQALAAAKKAAAAGDFDAAVAAGQRGRGLGQGVDRAGQGAADAWKAGVIR